MHYLLYNNHQFEHFNLIYCKFIPIVTLLNTFVGNLAREQCIDVLSPIYVLLPILIALWSALNVDPYPTYVLSPKLTYPINVALSSTIAVSLILGL